MYLDNCFILLIFFILLLVLLGIGEAIVKGIERLWCSFNQREKSDES